MASGDCFQMYGLCRWLSGKDLPAMLETQETQVRALGREDPLEEGMAAHSSVLAWRIPWTEEPGATVHGVTDSRTGLSD